MGVLSNELSSWRKHLVECKAGIVNTLNFRDTRPNVMLVMNPSNAKIMSCLDSIPTEKNYDFLIKNHYARLVGRPTPTSQVYFLSDYDVTLQVYSIYDKNFDPSWLSDFSIDNVNLTSETLQPLLDALKAQSKTKIAGVEDGVILPTHDSDILKQLSTFFNKRSYSELISSHELSDTTNLKSLLACMNNNYNKLSANSSVNLKQIYNLLTTLTFDGTKSIANITGKGADETSLKKVNDSIIAMQGADNATLSGAIDQLTTLVVTIQTLNNTLLDCKTLLTDIKTNTTPTTTP